MEEIFTAEFVIHEVSCSLPYISKPAITIRFLEFPTLTVFGIYQKTLIFNKGKSCKFSMTLTTLRAALRKFPLYVMLVDALPQNLKMIGTAAVDLSAFAEGGISTSSDFKRNHINLHDPIRNIVAKLDISISISQYTDGITRTPNEVFEKITQNNLKITPPELQVDKSISTDPLPQRIPGKLMTTAGTMTGEKPETKEVQTSVFEENYNPPPMFFTKVNAKAAARPVYYPTAPPVYVPPPVSEGPTELLIDRLIKEVQHLKQVSALQQQWSYPPVISFQQPEVKKQVQSSGSSARSGQSAKSAKSVEKVQRYSERESSVKSLKDKPRESVSEYSEDFEEESMVKSSSREGMIKCYVCGEMARISEAEDHPKNCRKIKDKLFSPRVDSSDTWGKDLIKSVTSIAEEYESDFHEESGSQY